MENERRRLRRGYKDLALQGWLESVAMRHEVPLLLVADGDGLLVAAGQDLSEAEEIASWAATMKCADGQVASCMHHGVKVCARRVAKIEETILVLAKDRGGQVQTALEEAGSGVVRILAEKMQKG
jgi:hypothetical protein